MITMRTFDVSMLYSPVIEADNLPAFLARCHLAHENWETVSLWGRYSLITNFMEKSRG